MQISDDQMYWFFSTSAQSIAGLYGLIMAAYVLFIDNLSKERQASPDKSTIIDRVRESVARLAMIISGLNAFAVAASIGGILAGPFLEGFLGRLALVVTAGLLVMSAIGISVLFTMRIFDPNAFVEMAELMTRELATQRDTGDTALPVVDAVKSSAEIEERLRACLLSVQHRYEIPDELMASTRAGGGILLSLGLLAKHDLDAILAVTELKTLVKYGRRSIGESICASVVKTGFHSIERLESTVAEAGQAG